DGSSRPHTRPVEDVQVVKTALRPQHFSTLERRLAGDLCRLLNQGELATPLPKIDYVADSHHLVLGNAVGDFNAVRVSRITLHSSLDLRVQITAIEVSR